ncbi:alpha/beta-hydrolase [Punctularia strigosozonata HHB-11173 SS5]|uniref:alpha/beta-hydrolase n=1 Tax=Punctularia strigosozonata (strain HHB-11173) TaxID=741275 RepID=UPI000441859E|nr:alpha/beta-hydrolase [Punctularia strigosozonata HHB-11173 SS5]EIN08026.1 alpha/beta-hydrolase [Punctularia strigosozonata HHB-11173 SS5]
MDHLPNLPAGVASRTLPVNDLQMHILEAGHGHTPQRPLVLLLHGFPELAYSYRKLLVPLSLLGYHVVAPDQRGYGRTCPSPLPSYADSPAPYRLFNLVRDVVALVYALGHDTAHAVIGHDFGSPLAGFCALLRPDVFLRLACMSAPFPGAPSLATTDRQRNVLDLVPEFAALSPPRKHYKLYYSTPAANADMHHPSTPGGLPAFLRAYFHAKSADASDDPLPHPLSPTAESLSALPAYYLMPLHASMPQAVENSLPSPEEVAANAWLTDAELAVYAREFARTGFQGGLNWYRAATDAALMADLSAFARKRVYAPAVFIGGERDWGVHQDPGALDQMREVCVTMGKEDVHIVRGAGHWIMQEQPEETLRVLTELLQRPVRKVPQ